MVAPATQQEAIQQFIDLANEMKNEGVSIEAVSTALMRACAVYSTYVVTGNDGALKAKWRRKTCSVIWRGTRGVVSKPKWLWSRSR